MPPMQNDYRLGCELFRGIAQHQSSPRAQNEFKEEYICTTSDWRFLLVFVIGMGKVA